MRVSNSSVLKRESGIKMQSATNAQINLESFKLSPRNAAFKTASNPALLAPLTQLAAMASRMLAGE
jgi:hypothetical protein